MFEHEDVQPGDTVAGNLGGFIALSPETSLRLVVSGAYQQDAEIAGTALHGSDQVAACFIIGGSTLLLPGTLLNVSAGIGLTDDSDDFSFSMSIPVRLRKSLFQTKFEQRPDFGRRRST